MSNFTTQLVFRLNKYKIISVFHQLFNSKWRSKCKKSSRIPLETFLIRIDTRNILQQTPLAAPSLPLRARTLIQRLVILLDGLRVGGRGPRGPPLGLGPVGRRHVNAVGVGRVVVRTPAISRSSRLSLLGRYAEKQKNWNTDIMLKISDQ